MQTFLNGETLKTRQSRAKFVIIFQLYIITLTINQWSNAMSETVYKIKNNINDQVYIGCTKDLYKRFLKHQSSLRCNRHTSHLFQDLYNRYSETLSLTIEPIATYDNQHDARQHELYLLCNSCNLLNTRRTNSGGDVVSKHPNYNLIVSKHQENYRSNVNFQDNRATAYGPQNPNYRHGLALKSRSCIGCGGFVSPYVERCMSCQLYNRSGANNSFYGKTHSESTRKALSAAKLGKPNLSCSKAIMVDGVKYISLNTAAKELNMVTSTLGHRCRSPNYPNVYYTE